MSHHISAMGLSMIAKALLDLVPADKREEFCARLSSLLKPEEAVTMRQMAGLPGVTPWVSPARAAYQQELPSNVCDDSPTEHHRFERGTCIYCDAKVGDVDEDRVREERQDRRDNE